MQIYGCQELLCARANAEKMCLCSVGNLSYMYCCLVWIKGSIHVSGKKEENKERREGRTEIIANIH